MNCFEYNKFTLKGKENGENENEKKLLVSTLIASIIITSSYTNLLAEETDTQTYESDSSGLDYDIQENGSDIEATTEEGNYNYELEYDSSESSIDITCDKNCFYGKKKFTIIQ